ncbi:MAG: ribose-phosphate pyrophosphokinase [SAR324 cluster bacterium]|nr:ribose-phosphate pyrophosphokinase [SAR324 cluster bacterium]MCH2265487.1 ribose-phosphate pyrophosphokinase [SAR324 cluster bacterium]
MNNHIIVSNVSDASFALGVGYAHSQKIDISDIIALKTFINNEFCPRFLQDHVTEETLGHGLKGKSVYIVSTHSAYYSRDELAMRNYLIAAAAKENGAEFVALVEPDLFYSAQDRGPRTQDHPQVTDFASREKFVGQPCSSEMYAQLLKTSGVDCVMTVHNHKPDVMRKTYEKVYRDGNCRNLPPFLNLDISPLIANYILRSGLVRLWNYGEHVGFVAPDDGAADFVNRVREFTGLHNSVIVTFRKTRHGQRDVTVDLSDDVELLKGRDIFILDDMVRTGGTIAANISAIAESKRCRPANIFFYSTHTTISPEARENLNSPHLNQFITSNTIPSVLNRDDQGRLRKKIVVLKIEKWIANAIRLCLEEAQIPDEIYGINAVSQSDDFYEVDLSTKNPLHNKSRVQQYELTI